MFDEPLLDPLDEPADEPLLGCAAGRVVVLAVVLDEPDEPDEPDDPFAFAEPLSLAPLLDGCGFAAGVVFVGPSTSVAAPAPLRAERRSGVALRECAALRALGAPALIAAAPLLRVGCGCVAVVAVLATGSTRGATSGCVLCVGWVVATTGAGCCVRSLVASAATPPSETSATPTAAIVMMLDLLRSAGCAGTACVTAGASVGAG